MSLELWTRCPKHHPKEWQMNRCLLCGGRGLVPVPFDEAVERMLDHVWQTEVLPRLCHDEKAWRDSTRWGMEDLLRAALGEE